MNNEQKIDFIYTTLLEMAPEVKSLTQSMRAMEHRIRAAELKLEQHEVKVSRLITDVDNMGRKVRHEGTVNKLKNGDTSESKLLVFMTSIIQSPHILLFIISGFMFFMSVIGMFVRFAAKLPPPTLNLEVKGK